MCFFVFASLTFHILCFFLERDFTDVLFLHDCLLVFAGASVFASIFAVSPANNPTLCLNGASRSVTTLTTCSLPTASLWWLYWNNMNLLNSFTGTCLQNPTGLVKTVATQNFCAVSSAQMILLSHNMQVAMRGTPNMCGEIDMLPPATVSAVPTFTWNTCQARPQPAQQVFSFWSAYLFWDWFSSMLLLTDFSNFVFSLFCSFQH